MPKGMRKGTCSPSSWSHEKILDAVEQVADTGVYKGIRGGAEIYEKTIDGILIRAKVGAIGIIDGHPIQQPRTDSEVQSYERIRDGVRD